MWTALILPFWLVRTQCNWRDTLQVWPGLLACGVVFGGIKFVWSNYIDAALVDIMAGIGTLVFLTLFFKVWKPRSPWRYPNDPPPTAATKYTARQVIHAWMPFLLIGVL